MAILEKTEF